MNFSDASALLATPEGDLLLASDETNALARLELSTGVLSMVEPPIDALLADAGIELETDSKGRCRELDLEAAAVVPTLDGHLAIWIGSHGRRKARRKGDGMSAPTMRPNRRWVVGTNLPRRGETLRLMGSPSDGLPAALLEPPEGLRESLEPLIAAEPLWANAGGWNIEGLATDPDGGLVIGFRSPIDARERAPVVALQDPVDMLMNGTPPAVVQAEWLDLGGRGIRSLSWSRHHGRYFLVAGPVGRVDPEDGSPLESIGEDKGFALFTWRGFGRKPRDLGTDLGGLRPEGMFVTSEGIHPISDDDEGIRRADDTGDDARLFARRTFVPLAGY